MLIYVVNFGSDFCPSGSQNAQDRESLERIYIHLLTQSTDKVSATTWIEFGADVELLSLKALRYMQQAELVLHTQDCPFVFVDLCRRDAQRQSFNSSVELSTLLYKLNKKHKTCVLIPSGSSEYALLQGKATVLKMAQQG